MMDKPEELAREILKPCPFCGAGANGPHKIQDGSLGADTLDNDFYSKWEIICSSFCTSKKAKTKDVVIVEWNNRPAEEAIRKEQREKDAELVEFYAKATMSKKDMERLLVIAKAIRTSD